LPGGIPGGGSVGVPGVAGGISGGSIGIYIDLTFSSLGAVLPIGTRPGGVDEKTRRRCQTYAGTRRSFLPHVRLEAAYNGRDYIILETVDALFCSLADGIAHRGQQLAAVAVVFTSKQTEINGTVTNEQGQPITDFTVLAFGVLGISQHSEFIYFRF
jgi:hypothetical protein